MGKSVERWGFVLLIAAIVSALLLCAPALRGQSLALDEHVSFYCSGAPSLEELWKRCSEVAVLPPLSHLLERAALAIGGRSESAFRIPSLMAYVLSVPVVWWVGRSLGGGVAGGIAAIIVAWHPEMLDEVRFARCYGLVLLLSTLSTGCVLQWRQAPARRIWLAAWTVSAAALCWTHYVAAPLVAAQSAMILVSLFQLPPLSRSLCVTPAIIAISLAGLSCLPLAPAVFRLSEWGSVIDFQRLPATIADAFGARWTLTALLVVAVAMVGNWSRRRTLENGTIAERAPIGWLLFLWLAPLAVVGSMALLGSPMLASPRYRVMVVGPSALAVGLALSRSFLPPVAVMVAVGALVLSIILHRFSPAVAGRLANPIEEEWKRIGLELKEEVNDPGVLVFTQTGLMEGLLLPVIPGSERFRTYVACRLGAFYTDSERALPIPLLWDGAGPLRPEYRTLLKARRVRRAWIVGANDTDLNAESLPVFAQFLEAAGFRRVEEESRPGITVLRFEAE